MKPLLIALFSLFLAGIHQVHADEKMTLPTLMSLESVESAKMAPNEKLVAFTQNIPRDISSEPIGPDWQALYLVNSKGIIRPLILGKNQIEQLIWSKDSKQLWLLMRRSSDSWFSIYMIRPDGGEALRVIAKQQHIFGFDLHPDGNEVLYWYPSKNRERPPAETQKEVSVIQFEQQFQLNHTLHKITLGSGQASDIQVPVNEHVLRAKYSYQGDKLLLKTAPSYNKDDEVMKPSFLIVDKNANEIFRIANRGKLAKAVFSPSGNKVAFIGAESTSSPDHAGLFVADLNKKTTSPLLPDFDGIVTEINWVENRHLLFLADTGTGSILASKNVNGTSNKYRTYHSSEMILRKLHAPDDNDNMVLLANTPEHPNELFWFKNKRMLRITDSNPALNEFKLGRQTRHSFPAKDDLSIEGILVSPPDAPANTPLPTIIFAHGGPEAHFSHGWLPHYLRPVHTLAALGYRSFLPNYRGSTARGEAFLKAGQGDYAGAEFDDLLAAKQWLVKKGFSLPDQVGIAGGSYGGYAAAWAATRFSPHFSAAVSVAGIGNKISKFGTTDIPNEMLQTHALAQPWDSWQVWLKASPIYYSEQHNTPLLIMHGMADKRVHYGQSLELYRHLKHRNQAPVSFYLYPDQGHYVLDAHTRLDIAKKMIGWFEEYLTVKEP